MLVTNVVNFWPLTHMLRMLVPAISPPRVKAIPAPINILLRNAMTNRLFSKPYNKCVRIEIFP